MKPILIRIVCLFLIVQIYSSRGSTFATEGMGPDCNQHEILVSSIDGVAIRGLLYENENYETIIYCHSLLGKHGGDEVKSLLKVFIDSYDLITFDFRGHETSSGRSTSGGDEILDLRAMVSFAQSRGYRKIYVIGSGLGGTVGARFASIFGNIDGLIVMSPSGFSPDISPFPLKLISDITLDTVFGKIPVRILTNTRLGPRYSAGFPADFFSSPSTVPVLIVYSDEDRFINNDEIRTIIREHPAPPTVLTVSGNKHAGDLVNESTLTTVREFLEDISNVSGDDSTASAAKEFGFHYPDSSTIEFDGDLPVPQKVIEDDLYVKLSGRSEASRSGLYTTRQIEEVLAFRGYTMSSVSLVDSFPNTKVRVTSPNIHALLIEGNRWVDDNWIRETLRLGGDYYNAHELDSAIRRLSSDPSIKTVKSRITERVDGDLDVHLDVIEKRTYGVLLATKFTDIDRYFGLGLTWNKLNRRALQFETKAMLGLDERDLLTYFSASKTFLHNSLTLNAMYFDIVKSRDDLDYIFTRQEVHETGGALNASYRFTSYATAEVGVFEKKHKTPEGSDDFPVESGTADGMSLKIYHAGQLPLHSAPRFKWTHTFYFQKMGIFDYGDYFFNTYQINLSGEVKISPHHAATTTFHGGWLSGSAPPQEHFSLGGMTTLPGYPDDSFINSRVALASQSVCIGASNWVDETSRWSPVKLILTFHAGTVWDYADKMRLEELKTDVGFELKYMEKLRFGIVWPTGRQRIESPRVYIGWGVHVY